VPTERRSRTLLAAAAIAAALGAAASPASAAEDAGLVFAQDETLALTAPSDRVPALVCNGANRPARALRGRYAGFAFKGPKGGVRPTSAVLERPDVGPADPSSTRRLTSLDPGGCGVVDVALTGKTLKGGTYKGALLVTSDGAGVARRAVQVTVKTDPVEPVSLAGAGDEVELQATDQWGWLPGGGKPKLDGGRSLPLKPTEPPPTIGAECTKETTKDETKCPLLGVVAQNLEIGKIRVDGPLDTKSDVPRLPVKLEGAGAAGEYGGSLALADDSEPKVKLKVRHGLLPAVVALLAGLAVTMYLSLWQKRWVPRRRIRKPAEALDGEYAAAIAEFREHVAAGGTARDPLPFAQFDRPSKQRVDRYRDEIKSNLAHYAHSTVYFDTKSEEYKALEKSVKDAGADIRCWREKTGLAGSLIALREEFDELHTWLIEKPFSTQDPAVLATAARALKGSALEVGEAVERAAAADTAAALLKRWQRLAERTLRLQLWWRALAKVADPRSQPGMSPQHRDLHTLAGARLAQVKAELLEAEDAAALDGFGIEKRLERAYDRLALLGGQYHVDEPVLADDPRDLGAVLDALGTPAFAREQLGMTQEMSGEATTEALADGLEKAAEAGGQFVGTAMRSAAVRDSKTIFSDIAYLLLSIGAALFVAVTAFYTDTFGSTTDYLKLVAVAAVTGPLATSLVTAIDAVLTANRASLLEDPTKPAVLEAESAAEMAAAAEPEPAA
jgi:hypothetical protein